MKTLKLTLLTIITACLTFSCSSDDDSSTASNAELIIGTWTWTASSYNGVAYTLTECDLMDTLTFTSTTYNYTEYTSGISPCTPYFGTSTYTISGNMLTWGSDTENLGKIVTLNDTTLVLGKEITDGNDTYINTDTYTRQ